MQNMLKLCTRGDYVIKLLNKYKVLLIVILLTVASLVYSITSKEKEAITIIEQTYDEKIEFEEDQVGSFERPIEQKMPVFICGEVKVPGVYEIESGSLIQDVLIEAGGFTEEANREATNLAKAVTAHEKIYIPKVGEEIDKVVDSYDNIKSGSESGRININTADSVELEKLPGIGEVKAVQIIAYRKENGLFKSLDELKNVSGIGDKTYESLLEHITIE